MKQRCKSHPNYGGRGITVCEEWSDSYISFKTWATQNNYSPDLCIDRIDNDGNYEPSNCRWATQKVNSRNKSDTVIVSFMGETRKLIEVIEELGAESRYHMALRRLKQGWTAEDAILRPPYWRKPRYSCNK